MEDAKRTAADARREIEERDRETERMLQEARGIDRSLREDARVQGFGKMSFERNGLSENWRVLLEEQDPIAGNRHIWKTEWMTRDGWTLGKDKDGKGRWTRRSETQA